MSELTVGSKAGSEEGLGTVSSSECTESKLDTAGVTVSSDSPVIDSLAGNAD